MKKLRTLLLMGASALISAALVAQAQVPGVNSTLNSVFTLAYDNSTMKQTFSATGAFTPAASPTDQCSLAGSATKLMKVRRILVSGTNTSVITEAVAVVKRSTANSGAGAALGTQVPYDSSNAAGTSALVEAWTTAPTLGTLVGNISENWVTFSNATTGVGAPLNMIFGQLGQPIVLRGVAQSVAVNMTGAGGGAGTVNCTFEWTEE